MEKTMNEIKALSLYINTEDLIKRGIITKEDTQSEARKKARKAMGIEETDRRVGRNKQSKATKVLRESGLTGRKPIADFTKLIEAGVIQINQQALERFRQSQEEVPVPEPNTE